MAEVDLESDQFMTLLTDALRAGPGSPEWHQAVGKLRNSGAKGADEMQLLIKAREDLESGSEYRAVTAGPGFTRKVLTAIEQDAGTSQRRGIPSANIIALVAAGVILAVVIVVAVVLFKSPPPTDKVQTLSNLYFGNPIASVDFESPTITDIPADWKLVGEVPLKIIGDGPAAKPANKGLRPLTTQPSPEDKREYRAGAIEKNEPINSDQAVMVEVTFKSNKPTDAIVPQVFVSDEPLDEAKGTSPRELVWLMKSGQPQLVLPNMSVPATGDKLNLKNPHTITVKVSFNRDTVIVESAGKRLWDGPHDLSASKPRYVGVRFLRKQGDASDGAWVASIKVLKP